MIWNCIYRVIFQASELLLGAYPNFMSSRHHTLESVHAIAAWWRYHWPVVYPRVLLLSAETARQRHASLELNIVQFRQLNRALRVNNRWRFFDYFAQLSFLNIKSLTLAYTWQIKNCFFFFYIFIRFNCSNYSNSQICINKDKVRYILDKLYK